MSDGTNIFEELKRRFGEVELVPQSTVDGIPTLWVPASQAHSILQYLRTEAAPPYGMLYDLTAIDERVRTQRQGMPPSDFTVVYQLLSFDRNEDVRIKVALQGDKPSIRSIVDLWPNANWYEREVWDMFGVSFEGHPNLTRILSPVWWEGHPLRKEHPSRRTEMGPFTLPTEKEEREQEALRFRPEEWGMQPPEPGEEVLYLNMGPQHPGTHGLLRIILQLRDEEITNAAVDIGYHHRGAEKIGERQTWHTYIPYTDRVEYLGGVLNNLAYLLAVEKLAGIQVPERAQVIRVMLCEFFRLSSHLVWYGTFAQDVGAMSPVFYMFSDRERVLDIVQAITGGRMHPSWFRIGGVAQDLPQGWDGMVREFLDYMPRRLREYDHLVMANPIFQGRTKGIGDYTVDEAIDWGVTGPGLRACGMAWDFRKKRPYSGYENFDFEIPTAVHGDCFDRGLVRVEEMRQSLRIIDQCLKHMPPGPYQAIDPLATPPIKDRTMHDIETLITHFLNVSWGPVIPPGEAFAEIEASKGNNGYYLISDGSTTSYRTRIRTPSFPHLQMLPLMIKGFELPDLVATLGSIDFVLSDIDR